MEFFERAISYLKAITTPVFLVSLEVINATLNLTKPVAKKTEHQKTASRNYFDCIRFYQYYQLQRCMQAFWDNEEIFVGLFRYAEGLYGESIPMP